MSLYGVTSGPTRRYESTRRDYDLNAFHRPRGQSPPRSRERSAPTRRERSAPTRRERSRSRSRERKRISEKLRLIQEEFLGTDEEGNILEALETNLSDNEDDLKELLRTKRILDGHKSVGTKYDDIVLRISQAQDNIAELNKKINKLNKEIKIREGSKAGGKLTRRRRTK